MTSKHRWYLAATIGLPLTAMTVYLPWIWPHPHGNSASAQVGPHFLSLLTGLPFVWNITFYGVITAPLTPGVGQT